MCGPPTALGIRAGSFGEQVGGILASCGRFLAEERPDRLLILGDTDSGLAAFVACRLGIPVYHMEAGNRCYDDRVPEEVNRRVIDQSSTILMPYTERSRLNLLREGFAGDGVYVTGNPMFEVLCRHEASIAASSALSDLGLRTGEYFLVTMHRQENVDVAGALAFPGGGPDAPRRGVPSSRSSARCTRAPPSGCRQLTWLPVTAAYAWSPLRVVGFRGPGAQRVLCAER